MKKGKMRSFSICLTDIPKDKMTKSEKNGKIYANFTSWDNDEPDQFGNDFSVTVSKTKEEAAEKVPTIYVGNGKIWEDKGAVPLTDAEKDDLPF